MLGSVTLTRLPRLPVPAPAAQTGSLIAPTPGNVTKIAVAPGETVAAGQVLLFIETMKMEQQVTAPADGVLAELRVSQGTQVNAGDVLAIVTDQEGP
jgi:propionyl-CoA carboxylase alpha chain